MPPFTPRSPLTPPEFVDPFAMANAHACPMPARGHSSAPLFSPDQVRELKCYFADMDHLLDNYAIVDEAAMKRHTLRYLDVETSELWEELTEYTAGTHTKWRMAIFKLYPGPSDDRKYTVADLDKLVSERARTGLSSVEDLGKYYRTFLPITRFLETKGRLSAREKHQKFIAGFPETVWHKVVRRLEIVQPNHDPDDPYPMDQVRSAAEWLFHSTTPSYASMAMPRATGVTESAHVPSTVKLEDTMVRMGEQLAVVVAALNNQVGTGNTLGNGAPAAPPRGYNPTVILNMVSANGAVDLSLGLAWNVPCEVEGITVYLQVHVIREPWRTISYWVTCLTF
ncbi:hypothetical protein H0H81_002029 [Sphagnurus paluster]|uniref:Uncharacterized protein n=1 Tax=Sphagnurus paluster TaxID=117069 RepID=A0A9P7GHK0_9AGAR|nr:hypothetical protein H0H81_002029 [Sphagnurus paluster]